MSHQITELMDTEAIWHQMRDALGTFIRRRVDNREVADDLLQDTFVRIHQGLQQPGDIQNPTAWIYQIARNLIVDHYRGQKRRGLSTRPLKEADDIAEGVDLDTGDPAREATVRELAQCLRPMVNALPEIYRQALALTDLDGFTQVEAAKRLGISTPGVKSRVQRGRRKLKQLLLTCCRIELDARGGVTSARRTAGCCQAPAPSTAPT